MLTGDNSIFPFVVIIHLAENRVAAKRQVKQRIDSTIYKRVKGEDQLRIIQ